MVPAKKKNDSSPMSSQDHDIGTCPAFLTLGLIANKWSVKILYTLIHSPRLSLRFSEIQKSLGNITQRELTKHLREFEKCGIVTRKAYPEVPPRVEYTMTELGLSLQKPMDALSDWANTYGETIYKTKKKFEDRKN